MVKIVNRSVVYDVLSNFKQK